MPEFAEVKDQVKQDWMDLKRRELEDETVNQILSSYEIVFEEPSDQDEEGAARDPEVSE